MDICLSKANNFHFVTVDEHSRELYDLVFVLVDVVLARTLEVDHNQEVVEVGRDESEHNNCCTAFMTKVTTFPPTTN